MVESTAKYTDQNMFGRGFPCPRCKNQIVASVQELFAGLLVCPTCNLQLSVDKKQSDETLNKLKEFNQKHSGIMNKTPAQKKSPKKMIAPTASKFVEDNSIKLIYKDESRLMRAFNKLFYFGKKDSKFMNYYATTGKNRIVYIPRGWWSKASDEEKVILLRHELIHMKQMERYGRFLFLFLYFCFPFPIGLAYYRAKFEKEGYEETLRARYEYWGSELITSRECKDWIVSQFTGGVYLWMWPFKKGISVWYDKTVREIISN